MYATRTNGVAYFPYAVTDRGTRHLLELAHGVRQGHRGVLFFLVNREDCRRVRPADRIDAVYGKTLRRVAPAGVEVLAYGCQASPEGLRLASRLEVDLSRPFLRWAW